MVHILRRGEHKYGVAEQLSHGWCIGTWWPSVNSRISLIQTLISIQDGVHTVPGTLSLLYRVQLCWASFPRLTIRDVGEVSSWGASLIVLLLSICEYWYSIPKFWYCTFGESRYCTFCEPVWRQTNGWLVPTLPPPISSQIRPKSKRLTPPPSIIPLQIHPFFVINSKIQKFDTSSFHYISFANVSLFHQCAWQVPLWF